jgi:hypothetical protein
MSYVEGHIRYNNTASLDIPEWYITKIEKEPGQHWKRGTLSDATCVTQGQDPLYPAIALLAMSPLATSLNF